MSAAKNFIVCGGRDYFDMRAMYKALDALANKVDIGMIIHGGAEGADALASAWAFQRCIPCLSVPANWGEHGKAAGPMRNQKMIEMVVDGVVAFPGGPGTKDMTSRAKAAGVNVWEPYRG